MKLFSPLGASGVVSLSLAVIIRIWNYILVLQPAANVSAEKAGLDYCFENLIFTSDAFGSSSSALVGATYLLFIRVLLGGLSSIRMKTYSFRRELFGLSRCLFFKLLVKRLIISRFYLCNSSLKFMFSFIVPRFVWEFWDLIS